MNVNLNEKSIQFLCDEWETVNQTIVYLQENLEELSPWRYQSLGLVKRKL